MTHYSPEELKRLEWWRGLLASVVFVAHIIQVIWLPLTGPAGLLGTISSILANISVLLFFVLSGILVSYSAINLSSSHGFDWKKYLINRITRIYPSLIFVLIFCALLMLVFPLLNGGTSTIIHLDSDQYLAREEFHTSGSSFITTFLMIPQGIGLINGPLWSLFIEWWLYISAMFFFLALSNEKSKIQQASYYTLSIIILIPVVYVYGIPSLFYIALWFLGCLYTIYFKAKKKIFSTLVGMCFVVLATIIIFSGPSALNLNKANPTTYGFVQLIFAILFIPVALKYSGKFVFNSISVYSYTLYIIHFPIVLFVFAVLRPQVMNKPIRLMIESVFLLFLVLIISRSIARYTEDKFRFRAIVSKLNSRFNFVKVDK